MKKALLFCGLICVLSACNDKAVIHDTDLGYQYFPLDSGAYISYRADSIFHDQPLAGIPGIHDTSSYFIKELVGEEFLDAEDLPSSRITRYKKDSLHHDWVLVDVWFARRNTRNAEKVEENVRFIKMGFPISQSARWDGNAKNVLDEWVHKYDSISVSKTYGDLSFINTVGILQRYYRTEVNDEFAYEVYAPNLGLIYRTHKLLYTRPSYLNNPVADNIISGNEFTWEIIDYGMEN